MFLKVKRVPGGLDVPRLRTQETRASRIRVKMIREAQRGRVFEVELFQRLHKFCHRLGIIRRQARERLLMRSLLGIVSLREQVRDLFRSETSALQCRTDLTLAFCAVASRAFGFVSRSAILRKCG